MLIWCFFGCLVWYDEGGFFVEGFGCFVFMLD